MSLAGRRTRPARVTASLRTVSGEVVRSHTRPPCNETTNPPLTSSPATSRAEVNGRIQTSGTPSMFTCSNSFSGFAAIGLWEASSMAKGWMACSESTGFRPLMLATSSLTRTWSPSYSKSKVVAVLSRPSSRRRGSMISS